MKAFGIGLTILTAILLIMTIATGFIGAYQYEKQFSSYWNLADKSSTITKKAEYIDKFVNAIENGKFTGEYNAIIMQTPDNSFDQNFIALKTLQQRLHEISGMDVTSFQYQTAIQQITEQEQGEAYEMLKVFKGIWWKENHFFLWNWICFVQLCIVIIGLVIGIAIWDSEC